MIGNDSCARARPTCSSTSTHTNRAARLLMAFSFRMGWTVRGEALLAGLPFRSAVEESPLTQGYPRTITAVTSGPTSHGRWSLQRLLQMGYVHVVRGVPGRYTTRAVQDHLASVQMGRCGVTEAFTYGSSC